MRLVVVVVVVAGVVAVVVVLLCFGEPCWQVVLGYVCFTLDVPGFLHLGNLEVKRKSIGVTNVVDNTDTPRI